ncbi:MAG: hypothetical protein IJX47_00940 [Clostridia bacterium]|nr:hypothetical protein [Clostridia bacterium]
MRTKSKEWFKRKSTFQIVLSVFVSIIMITCLLRGAYQSVFLCVLTLLLFDIPIIANKVLKVTLPKELEIIILLFIFAAEILGELGSFYTHIPWWDTMLHTVNGFLMAAIGFAIIDILNNSPKFHINLSPIFVAVVSFCFSMTIGVLWEFFEFAGDMLIGTDMQKDHVIHEISSVALNPSGLNDVVNIPNITGTALLENGEIVYVIENGYLDVGIIDTMKDLIVNCIGAVVFSVIGYFYIVGRNKGVFASKFIPQYTPDEKAN